MTQFVQSASLSRPAKADSQKWQAVLKRDHRYDGSFVYAVTSTGIFCRPSCPSRRPSRNRVQFFAGPANARAAGFRPCLRCRPENETPDVRLARATARIIVEKMSGGGEFGNRAPTLSQLGKELRSSPWHLQRVFKRIAGISPKAFADALRLERFRQSVSKGETVTAALYDAGYSAPSRLYAEAARRLGMTPGTLSKGGRGVDIRFIIVGSSLGRLLVARTAKGICAVTLGSKDQELVASLERTFPNSKRVQNDAGLKRDTETVLAMIEGEGHPRSLSLDVEATTFQRRVWDVLRQIPKGETRSYAQLARQLGKPSASRAVAAACAANPVAVVIPCHRVVRSDGNLAGYRWGIERKHMLLQRERKR